MVTFLVCLVVVGGAVILILRVTLADVVKPATDEAEAHGGAAPRTLVDTARKATTFLIPTDGAGHARRSRTEIVDGAPGRRAAAAFLIPTGAVTARIKPSLPPPGPDLQVGAPSPPVAAPEVGPSMDERVAGARAREAARVAEAERIAEAERVAAAEREVAEAARLAAAERAAAAEREAAEAARVAAEAARVEAAERAAVERLVTEQREREAEAERVLADEQVEAARTAQAETARMSRLDDTTGDALPSVPVRSARRYGVADPIDEPIVWRRDPSTAVRTGAAAVATAGAQDPTGWPGAPGAVADAPRPTSRPAAAVPRPARPTFARRLLARLVGAVKLLALLVLVGTGLALVLGAAVVLFTLGVRAAIGS